MFPIKVEVNFTDDRQASEWKCRFNVPIFETIIASGINVNPRALESVFMRDHKFKRMLYRLPGRGKQTFEIHTINQLNILELYLATYNTQLARQYKASGKEFKLKKYNLKPLSQLSGVITVRRVLYFLAKAAGQSILSQATYSSYGINSTGMFKFTLTLEHHEAIDSVVKQFIDNGVVNVDYTVFKPDPFFTKEPICIKFYSGSAPSSPEDDACDANLLWRWPLNIESNKEDKSMLLSVKTPKYTYFHGSIPFEQLNSFLSAISKHEQDWSIHCVDEPKQLSNTKYSIHTLPFEDTTMVLVFEEKTSNPQTYYIISIPYNVTSSYISDILDTCMPEKYRITIRCNSIVEAQTLQLRLAAMEKVQSTQLGAINVIQRHLDAFLGDDSVWGFSGSKISLTKTDFKELGLRISMAINHDDQAVQATYTLSGVTEKDMQDIVRYVQKSLMPQLVSSLRPSFKVFFIKSSNVPSTNLSVKREQ